MARMKIAFVVPPFPGRDMPDSSGIPLGPLYLAGALPEGWHATLIDAYSAPLPIEDTIMEITGANPDVVAFSMPFSPQMVSFGALSEGVKRQLKGCITIAGGEHVSFMPERTLKEFPELDCIVLGEGERVMNRLLNGISSTGQWATDTIAGIDEGIAYIDNGKFVSKGFGRQEANLDNLPLPDYSLIRNPGFYSPRIMSSRGCPRGCEFCASTKFWGGVWRAHSPERVLDEIQRALLLFGDRPISFGDDNFAVDRGRVTSICECMQSRGIKPRFGISAHPDDLDAGLIDMMAKAGLDRIFLGLESGRKKIRHAIGKDFNEGNLDSALEECRKIGVSVHASFMLGIPGETEEDLKATLEFAGRLPIASLGFHIFNPLPGSGFSQDPAKYGFETTSEDYADMGIEGRCRVRSSSLHPLVVLDYYYRSRAIAAQRALGGASI